LGNTKEEGNEMKKHTEKSAQGNTIVITETIDIKCDEIIKVDSSIIEQMKKRLVEEQLNYILDNDPLGVL